MSGLTVLDSSLFMPMLAVHTWLFGYEHLVATYTRLGAGLRIAAAIVASAGWCRRLCCWRSTPSAGGGLTGVYVLSISSASFTTPCARAGAWRSSIGGPAACPGTRHGCPRSRCGRCRSGAFPSLRGAAG